MHACFSRTEWSLVAEFLMSKSGWARRYLLLVTVVAWCPMACRDAGPDPVRWECNADSDCMNSCALGAVNAGWYATHAGSFVDCLDGCANQLSAPPRCVDGSCVAFQHEPSNSSVVRQHDHCTRKR